jgi:hypothetical protein
MISGVPWDNKGNLYQLISQLEELLNDKQLGCKEITQLMSTPPVTLQAVLDDVHAATLENCLQVCRNVDSVLTDKMRDIFFSVRRFIATEELRKTKNESPRLPDNIFCDMCDQRKALPTLHSALQQLDKLKEELVDLYQRRLNGYALSAAVTNCIRQRQTLQNHFVVCNAVDLSALSEPLDQVILPVETLESDKTWKGGILQLTDAIYALGKSLAEVNFRVMKTVEVLMKVKPEIEKSAKTLQGDHSTYHPLQTVKTAMQLSMYSDSISDCIRQLNALQDHLRGEQVSVCNALDLSAIFELLQQVILAVGALSYDMKGNTLEQLDDTICALGRSLAEVDFRAEKQNVMEALMKSKAKVFIQGVHLDFSHVIIHTSSTPSLYALVTATKAARATEAVTGVVTGAVGEVAIGVVSDIGPVNMEFYTSVVSDTGPMAMNRHCSFITKQAPRAPQLLQCFVEIVVINYIGVLCVYCDCMLSLSGNQCDSDFQRKAFGIRSRYASSAFKAVHARICFTAISWSIDESCNFVHHELGGARPVVCQQG